MKSHFLNVKRTFFPRWDRDNEWRVTTRSRRPVHGRCDKVRRIIEIVAKHTDPDKRDALLIHEICHAVAGGGHGKVWQRRMEKAASKAKTIGRDKLAKILCDEVVGYEESIRCGVGSSVEFYQRIEDIVLEHPEITWVQLKRGIAYEYGLLANEVLDNYPRSQRVYEQGQRKAKEFYQTRAKIKQRIQMAERNRPA